MMADLLKLDSGLTLFISGHIPHTTLLDAVFSFLSFQGITVAIWLLIVTFLVFMEERRDKRFIWYFAGSLLATFVITSIVLKTTLPRIRPYMRVPMAASCPVDSSFPSGHAAVAFAAATMLAFYDKKRRWIYYGLAFFISLSRIYLYCHYLLDVVAGGLVGGAISLMVSRIHMSHNTKRGRVHKK